MTQIRETVRGKVRKSSPGTWTSEVFIGGKLYLTDNTGDWRVVYDICRRDVEALSRLLTAGHTFHQTWDEIIGAAVADPVDETKHDDRVFTVMH